MKPSEPDLSIILIPLLAQLPGVHTVRKGAVANFTVNKKIFAFTKGNAVVLKLPRLAIEFLLAERKATMLTMGKRTMKEWVTIRYGDFDECEKDLPLFKEAMGFVSQQKKILKGAQK